MIDIQLTPALLERDCRIDKPDSLLFDSSTPWDDFMDGMSVHLGKRSMGWKFCWNFHNNKYYKNKEELIEFIQRGRVVDEYGKEMKPGEFIEMAMDWGQPDGCIYNQEYLGKNPTQRSFWWANESDHFDTIIDGLRVSKSTEFS